MSNDPNSQHNPPATPKAILLIESHEGIALVARKHLEGAGFMVVTAASHTEAQLYISQQHRASQPLPDLILLGALEQRDEAVAFLECLDSYGERAPRVVLLITSLGPPITTLPHRIRAVGFQVDPLIMLKLLRTVVTLTSTG